MAWPERFASPLPIRSRGSVHLYAARDLALGRDVTLALAAPRSTPLVTARRLDRAAEALRAVEGPMIPRVLDRVVTDEIDAIVLDHATVLDGEAAVQRLAELGRKLTYAEAMGFVDGLCSLLVRVHAARDPVTRAPRTLGALAWPAFLCDAQGDLVMLGPGDPLVVDDGPAPPGVFRAPEVAAGAAPSPASDVLAAGMLVRSMVGAVQLPDPIARVIRGAPKRGDAKIAATLLFANVRLFGGLARRRPSAAEMHRRLRGVWDVVGIEPDLTAFRNTLRLAVADIDGSEHGEARDLAVDREALWFEPHDRARASLQGRGPLRRVLLALVAARLADPGRALGVQDLLGAGWPGEDPLPEAGANRVYQSIATLRRMGLRDSIERHDGGYRIDPKIRVRVVS